jgi:hypothetical protein
MFSKNLPSLLSIIAVLFTALIIGIFRSPDRLKTPQRAGPQTVLQEKNPPLQEQIAENVPSIGRIQVLNGCGIDGAADKMTDFLRTKKFNVANTGNASSWNYQFTMVVSHTKDMAIARQIAQALSTSHMVLMRKEDRPYDVTVIIGPDYEERIRE